MLCCVFWDEWISNPASPSCDLSREGSKSSRSILKTILKVFVKAYLYHSSFESALSIIKVLIFSISHCFVFLLRFSIDGKLRILLCNFHPIKEINWIISVSTFFFLKRTLHTNLSFIIHFYVHDNITYQINQCSKIKNKKCSCHFLS